MRFTSLTKTSRSRVRGGGGVLNNSVPIWWWEVHTPIRARDKGQTKYNCSKNYYNNNRIQRNQQDGVWRPTNESVRMRLKGCATVLSLVQTSSTYDLCKNVQLMSTTTKHNNSVPIWWWEIHSPIRARDKGQTKYNCSKNYYNNNRIQRNQQDGVWRPTNESVRMRLKGCATVLSLVQTSSTYDLCKNVQLMSTTTKHTLA